MAGRRNGAAADASGAAADDGSRESSAADRSESKFIAQAIKGWLLQASLDTLYMQKGRPWEDGYVGRFHATPRDELLNRELFLSFPEARHVLG
jgi:transposase InsO family protein